MKLHTFIKLQDNITIYCNTLNWVLDYGDVNNRLYFPSLDILLDDLLELRLVRNALSVETIKDSKLIIDLIETTRVQIREDIESIKSLLMDADTAREGGDFNKEVH